MENIADQKLTLFEIQRNRIALEDVLEQLGGELTPEIEAALAINKEQLADKGESYIVVLEQLHAFIEFNKRYKDKAESNITRAKVTMDRLESRLLDAKKLYGEFQAGIHTVSSRKSKAVNILDVNELPTMYTSKTVTVTPDKKLIKSAIDGGLEVPGAELVTRENLALK